MTDGDEDRGPPVAGESPAPGAAPAPAPGPDPSLVAVETAAPRRRTGLLRRIFHRRSLPTPRTRRGLLLTIVLAGGVATGITAGAAYAFTWTETADFCGLCHTMGPELKAYAASPHREVACAECHVAPGLDGWVKAKTNGLKQVIEILTGQFPRPIPAPDHADLPPASKTCVTCHDVGDLVANGGPVRLVLQTRYRLDESNTREVVALVLRPYGFGGSSGTRGVHWHIDSDVEYRRADEHAQEIDLVTVTAADGTVEQFIASSQVGAPTDVAPDIERLTSEETGRRMDCLDCHNRVGHEVPSLDRAIDDSIEAGRIDPALPSIKREAERRLSIEYASIADADRAIAGLRDYYAGAYPLIAATRASQVDAAIADLEGIYRLSSTPEMRVTAATYPNNLGHQSAPGCFRCHDGAHYRVVDGAVTDETIPSGCATCHTFPQIGAIESGVLIGQRPATHDDRLWVFDHKASVSSVDASNTTCGACHTRTYCENCHNTPAVKVPHDDMVFDHASVVRNVGNQACAYCHQPVYCSQCHAGQVLPNPFPTSSPSLGPAP